MIVSSEKRMLYIRYKHVLDVEKSCKVDRTDSQSQTKESKAFNPKLTIPIVKYSEQVAVWGCFSAAKTGKLHLVKGNMNAVKY